MKELEKYLQKEAESVNETQVVYLTSVILGIFGEDMVSKNLSQVSKIIIIIMCIL